MHDTISSEKICYFFVALDINLNLVHVFHIINVCSNVMNDSFHTRLHIPKFAPNEVLSTGRGIVIK